MFQLLYLDSARFKSCNILFFKKTIGERTEKIQTVFPSKIRYCLFRKQFQQDTKIGHRFVIRRVYKGNLPLVSRLNTIQVFSLPAFPVNNTHPNGFITAASKSFKSLSMDF
ncbi:hypothetical protein CHUAL_012305 [Chamberlinius hualienensis]